MLLDTHALLWLSAGVPLHPDAQPLTSAIALATAELPNPLHDDPADRLLIATARDLDVPLVTRDARILAYAAAGHVRAIAC